MTITFLGTGPSRPIRARGRSHRLQSAALVETGGGRLLLDAGPSIVRQLRHAGIAMVDAVALTHRHADAAGGLASLDRYLPRAVPVYVGPGERPWYRPARFRHLVVREFRHQAPFLRGPLTATAFLVHHANDPRRFPTHGFRLRAERMRVTYASDLKDVPAWSRRFLRGNDLLVVDGAGWTRDLPNHRGILNHVRGYLQAGNRRILFTQIGRPVPRHEAANRLLRRVASRAALAYDGMVVRV